MFDRAPGTPSEATYERLRRQHTPWGLMLAVVLAVTSAAAASRAGNGAVGWRLHATPTHDAKHVPGRVLVKFRARLDAAAKADVTLRNVLGAGLDGARPVTRRATPYPLPAGLDRLYEIPVDPETDVAALAAKLTRLSSIEYAEPIYLYEQAVDTRAWLPRTALENPDDPDYPAQQRHLGIMEADSAWTFVKSENGLPVPVVCIIDGGTNWQHEDLMANAWTNLLEIPGNGIDDDLNGYVDDIHGWDFQADDGDPRGEWGLTPSNSNHGTHTAGLAAAVTDNSTGIAAPSWNPQLMSVNATGSSDGSIGFGYSGIVYAAENGADIVSLSWGGFSSSQALQDVIDFAVSQGTCVIAAAGNNHVDVPFVPAAYTHVVAVANVWGTDLNPSLDDQRYGTGSASNYGGWLDVSAAGVSMRSTFDFNATNQYGLSTGTSMSCPVAAGVAALIVAQNPTWGPLKVAEQLRVSCDNINSVNPGFEDLLGRGRVNMRKAVTLASPGVRVVDWTFSDPNGDGHLSQGESVTMTLDLHNYLDDATNLSLSFSSASPWISISDGSESIGSLVEDADTQAAAAFAFTVDANTPVGTPTNLRVDMTADGGYADFQFIPVVLQPVVETHDINNVRVSVTSTGGVGWIGFAGGFGEKGNGFSWQGGPNLLFEGALMLGTSAASLSDAARENGESTNFDPTGNVAPTKSTPGATGDQEIVALFDDDPNTTTPLGVAVELRSIAFSTPGSDDFVYLGYDIENTSGADFNGLWVGLFFDWDIDADHFGTNRAAWDPSRRLGYAWDNNDPSLPYVGVMALSGPQVGYSAIRNDGVGQSVNIYDGFTKSEKWNVLEGGTGFTTAGPFDISHALSAGPYDVAAGASITAWFALLAGDDLADLQANADIAIMVFGDSVTTAVEDGEPEIDVVPQARLLLQPAVPNPFNPGTHLQLVVDRTRDVRVTVFDARGRRVRALLDGRRPAGVYDIVWDGRDDLGRRSPSGVYFARLDSERRIQVQRLVLAK